MQCEKRRRGHILRTTDKKLSRKHGQGLKITFQGTGIYSRTSNFLGFGYLSPSCIQLCDHGLIVKRLSFSDELMLLVLNLLTGNSEKEREREREREHERQGN